MVVSRALEKLQRRDSVSPSSAKVLLDLRDLQAIMAYLAEMELQEHLENLVKEDLLENLVPMDPLGSLEEMEMMAFLEDKGHKDQQERMARRVTLELKAYQDHKDLQELQGQEADLVRRDLKEGLDPKDSLDHLERMV